MLSKTISYCVIILLVFSFSLDALAAEALMGMPPTDLAPSRHHKQRSKRERAQKVDKNERRAALESQAREYAGEMQKHFDKIAEAVNSSSSIDAQMQQDIKDTVRSGRKNSKYLDKKDKSLVLVTQAWASYFNGSLRKAERSASRAYATDPTNGDAYASQFIFSILSGKQPRAISKSRSSRNRVSIEFTESKLDFHIVPGISRTINKRLSGISDVFKQLDFDGEYIGLLLWQFPDSSTIKDPNSLKDTTIDRVEQIDAQGQRMVNSQTQTIEEELAALQNLSLHNKTKKKFKLATIILNNEESFSDALEFAKTLSADKFLVNLEPLKVSMPDFKKMTAKSEFAEIKKSKLPVFVIFDSNGIIKYAGSARGIAPEIILNALLPGSIKKTQDGSENEIENSAASKKKIPTTPNAPMSGTKPTFDAAPTKANKVGDPNNPQESGYVQLSDTDEIKAQNLITKARMYRGSHTRLGSSKRVVQACREVISTYPNTKYAQEAKEILRSIPAHQRKKCGVTEEELK